MASPWSRDELARTVLVANEGGSNETHSTSRAGSAADGARDHRVPPERGGRAEGGHHLAAPPVRLAAAARLGRLRRRGRGLAGRRRQRRVDPGGLPPALRR